MKVELHESVDEALYDQLVGEVRAHNFENMGPERSQPLMVTAHDAEGDLIGGIAGRTIYRNFLIDVLWVADRFRKAGLGSKLMNSAEAQARHRGCLVAQVDTLSFQAPAFYSKLGFEVVGRIDGFPGSPERFFLLKRFSQ